MVIDYLSDEECLAETGHLLALAAIRQFRQKPDHSKNRLAGGGKPRLIIRNGEKFVAQECLPGGPEQISLN